MNRGDVVILRFPFRSGIQSKVRPSLVVQNDRDNQRLQSVIVALITGNVKRAALDSQVLVEPQTVDGTSSGLHGPSLVNCSHLYSVDKNDISRTIGRLSSVLMDQVDNALRKTLEL